MINQAFLHVDVLKPHVQKGRYEIVGPTGEIILPSVWEHIIQPGDALTMIMWPIDKGPVQGPPPHVRKPVPSIKKQSIISSEEVETNISLKNGVIYSKRQKEADKAPTGSQKHKSHPQEDKQNRDNRWKDTSSR